MTRTRWITVAVVAVAVLLLSLVRFEKASAPTADTADTTLFIVSRNATKEDIQTKLATQGYLGGSHPLFRLALFFHGGYGAIAPGGYRMPPNAGSWRLASTLTHAPALRWVTIPEGLRREQVAERIGKALGWPAAKQLAFLDLASPTPYDLTEGFYFPDTYLIPADESEDKVQKRLIARFNETFDPLYPKFQAANIKPTTAVKMASLIQRESGGKSDMRLIAGILWNRLEQKMPLQIDATLQYVRDSSLCVPAVPSGSMDASILSYGDRCKTWWTPITKDDKNTDSAFNTYQNAGLPPQPIASPGADALAAVLDPQETTCLYYIHDSSRQIHCAATYEEHLANIDRYLR